MAKFGTYVQEAYDELLHKVTWPSWSSLQQTTAIVLVSLALVTGIVFGMNAAADAVLNFIYSLL